ncbi:MAG: hypothetical protein ABIT76_13505 [Chthoniobacterales bacterium]
MDLYEAKSDRGLERRVDEGDLRNLYRAGYLHLDSQVRRSGSPNWFRVDEMFPNFSRIPSGKKYSANFKAKAPGTNMRKAVGIILLILIVAVLLARFSQKISTQQMYSAPLQDSSR